MFVYRPGVFDSQGFPAACIPTLYLSNGPHRNRRPEQRRPDYRPRQWHATLYLEPDVVLAEERYDDREGALEGGAALARRFAAGELDRVSVTSTP